MTPSLDEPGPRATSLAMTPSNSVHVGACECIFADGTTIIHSEPARFFEVPIQLRLSEDLNFLA